MTGKICPVMTLKLTNQQFDSCRLEVKLSFPLSEAARLVLVHGIEDSVAAGIVGLREEGDLQQIRQAVALIEQSILDDMNISQ